jgi:hypothetical protein
MHRPEEKREPMAIVSRDHILVKMLHVPTSEYSGEFNVII